MKTTRSILSNPSSISAGLSGQKHRTALLQRSKLLSHDDKVSNEMAEAHGTAQRSEKTSRSKSKDKKVKFKEVYESRNIQAIQQERQKKDQYLEDFRGRSRSGSSRSSRSGQRKSPRSSTKQIQIQTQLQKIPPITIESQGYQFTDKLKGSVSTKKNGSGKEDRAPARGVNSSEEASQTAEAQRIVSDDQAFEAYQSNDLMETAEG